MTPGPQCNNFILHHQVHDAPNDITIVGHMLFLSLAGKGHICPSSPVKVKHFANVIHNSIIKMIDHQTAHYIVNRLYRHQVSETMDTCVQGSHTSQMRKFKGI